MISTTNHENDRYDEFEKSVNDCLKSLGSVPLFTTDAANLFDIYLSNIPEESRQHYNCHACKNFIERFGGLVAIAESGEAIPVMWGEVPPLFQASVAAMIAAIKRAKVTGVFLSKDAMLGTPITGEWTHLHAPNPVPFATRLHQPSAIMAEKRSDFILLKQSLADYPIEVITQAFLFLKSDALYRSEKVLGIAEWFKGLHDICNAQKTGKVRDNLVWRAVALAPPGFCHVKNTMIGTLLDDIVSGLPSDVIQRRFAEKMHPLQYQRPQSAPTAGNIEQAEKIVEKLGIARSLVRRFARLGEVKAIWKTAAADTSAPNGGVFSHLTPKGAIKSSAVNAGFITWRKFYESVLPDVLSMDVLVKSRDNFSAILTAEHMDAPPIIQWDSEEQRNPFSWYVYNGGSYASQWGLSEGYAKVTAICDQPSAWYDENAHQGKSIMFLIEGAKDSRKGQGNALFPEILKSELREIRSTIEAYSHSAEILGYENASACGLRLQADHRAVTVKVKTVLGEAVYTIDRWD